MAHKSESQVWRYCPSANIKLGLTMATGNGIIAECHVRACELLRRNLIPSGLMAASVKVTEQARKYYAIFARDVGISAIGIVVSAEADLIEGVCQSLRTLGRHQAANGQIPKFVDPNKEIGDFWYLGCIDATLWWLLAIDFVSRHTSIDLKTELVEKIQLAITWLQCQEHPLLYLLQQNEASDWADIMPRSGFVLYTNAIWFQVKRSYQLPHLKETRYHFKHLFHPFAVDLPEYQRLRLLMHFVRQKVAYRELYLSFVNFSFFGNEGDVFGNLLAILFGLADSVHADRILRTLRHAHADIPIPVCATLSPIRKDDPLWRAYMGRHRQNLEYRYHNGGAWPFIGGFWVTALSALGHKHEAKMALEKLAAANQINDWQFNEWFHGKSGEPQGMPGQSWNAAMFLLAEHSLDHRVFKIKYS